MRLLLQEDTKEQILAEDIWLFENSILKDPAIRPYDDSYLTTSFHILKRYWRKWTGAESIQETRKKYLSDPVHDPKSIFTILMGVDSRKYMPYADRTNHARLVYMFDAWPKEYERIRRFVNNCRIDKVFVSASQSAEDLNKLLSREIFHYIPEGIDPNAYRYVSYDAKDIDVLALGRKYDKFHQRILPVLQQADRTYLYEIEKGRIVFPGREGLIDGLSRTKISICVPGNITHPERSGHVETMTMRYLQSMASKCLILGHAPAEMIELFGYNPVVEIDWEQPETQIMSMLDNFQDHISLIERNHHEVWNGHTWTHRFEQIKKILAPS